MRARATRRGTHDGEQGRLLAEVAGLVDAGLIRSTMRENLGTIPTPPT